MSDKTSNSKYVGDCAFLSVAKKLLTCIKNPMLKIR